MLTSPALASYIGTDENENLVVVSDASKNVSIDASAIYINDVDLMARYQDLLQTAEQLVAFIAVQNQTISHLLQTLQAQNLTLTTLQDKISSLSLNHSGSAYYSPTTPTP